MALQAKKLELSCKSERSISISLNMRLFMMAIPLANLVIQCSCLPRITTYDPATSWISSNPMKMLISRNFLNKVDLVAALPIYSIISSKTTSLLFVHVNIR